MDAQEELLEAVARMAGCPFLSDLHLAENRARVVQALRTVSPERYSPQEWQDAACYLLSPQGLKTP